jgi:hypothetical protein
MWGCDMLILQSVHITENFWKVKDFPKVGRAHGISQVSDALTYQVLKSINVSGVRHLEVIKNNC